MQSSSVERTDTPQSLDAVFGDRLTALPPETEEFPTFHADSLPDLPDALETDQISIQYGVHQYEAFRVDFPQIVATPASIGQLGLFVLKTLLSSKTNVRDLTLTDPRSDVRVFRVTAPHPQPGEYVGLCEQPVAFTYVKQAVEKHPWYLAPPPVSDLPVLQLTNREELLVTPHDWAHRDVLKLAGTSMGVALFAELLLNLGQPTNTTNEVVLETEGGFRGVGPHSCELRISLPGSLSYPA